MIEALLVVLIAFTALFYFMKQVGDKVDAINQHQLDLYKKQYTVLLKSEKQNREQIKHMSKQINSLFEQLNVLKNVKKKANIFSLNNKKQEIENETD